MIPEINARCDKHSDREESTSQTEPSNPPRLLLVQGHLSVGAFTDLPSSSRSCVHVDLDHALHPDPSPFWSPAHVPACDVHLPSLGSSGTSQPPPPPPSALPAPPQQWSLCLQPCFIFKSIFTHCQRNLHKTQIWACYSSTILARVISAGYRNKHHQHWEAQKNEGVVLGRIQVRHRSDGSPWWIHPFKGYPSGSILSTWSGCPSELHLRGRFVSGRGWAEGVTAVRRGRLGHYLRYIGQRVGVLPSYCSLVFRMPRETQQRLPADLSLTRFSCL